MLSKDYEKLQEVIEYKFNNLEVLRTALTHKSYAAEYGGKKSYNERMEFLGDSILSAVIVETLYLIYPSESEGKLSQLKAQIVSASNLSIWAKEINLGDYIFLGKSEDVFEARKRESLLCDVFEAVVGAVYLDGGFENAKKFVLKFLNTQKEIIITDYKSRLQELAQSVYKELPEYKIIKEFGPDHNKKFEAAVYVNRRLLGRGIGSSKKEAQQSAAKQAMKNIK
ncbi:MAG: ribonuclease III [Endomicrobium sp.]|jgi:ribonuclease-3|nr:ribonuclease III [Endomicrobium sp.]MDR2644945.1 ribonuclease III [Endomicrobium sp.]